MIRRRLSGMSRAAAIARFGAEREGRKQNPFDREEQAKKSNIGSKTTY
jgi:hypothetical protein